MFYMWQYINNPNNALIHINLKNSISFFFIYAYGQLSYSGSRRFDYLTLIIWLFIILFFL